MKTPIVTVLMPVYNTEKYLKEAIDSILQQTFTDFEFLIIDDCSTDSSADIIRSYKDPRIRVVRNDKNMGMSATLNKGIKLSNTELIARMDADDISYRDRLKKQVNFFSKNADYALLYTWAREVDINLKPVGVEEYKTEHYYYASNFENWIYHPTIMYKKSAAINVGLYSTYYCEDYDLFWKLGRKYKVGCLEEVFLDYRLSDESLCRVVKKNEYEQAHHQQVVRNIHYYTGKDYAVSYEEVECFRYNFEPISKQPSLAKYISCIQKLDFISKCILKRANVNKDDRYVIDAWRYRREVIITGLLQSLRRQEKFSLALQTRSWKVLKKLFTKGSRQIVKGALGNN